MKKNTVAKWMLAGAAMVAVFACQSKGPKDDSKPSDSCGCTSSCSPLLIPTTPAATETAVSAVEVNQASEETYVIEIVETEEVAIAQETPAEASLTVQDTDTSVSTTTQTSTDTAPATSTTTETTTDPDAETSTSTTTKTKTPVAPTSTETSTTVETDA